VAALPVARGGAALAAGRRRQARPHATAVQVLRATSQDAMLLTSGGTTCVSMTWREICVQAPYPALDVAPSSDRSSAFPSSPRARAAHRLGPLTVCS